MSTTRVSEKMNDTVGAGIVFAILSLAASSHPSVIVFTVSWAILAMILVFAGVSKKGV